MTEFDADDIALWGNDNIVCPWCGYVHEDSYEFGSEREESGESECHSCDKPIAWERCVSVTYNTSKPAAAKAAREGK